MELNVSKIINNSLSTVNSTISVIWQLACMRIRIIQLTLCSNLHRTWAHHTCAVGIDFEYWSFIVVSAVLIATIVIK